MTIEQKPFLLHYHNNYSHKIFKMRIFLYFIVIITYCYIVIHSGNNEYKPVSLNRTDLFRLFTQNMAFLSENLRMCTIFYLVSCTYTKNSFSFLNKNSKDAKKPEGMEERGIKPKEHCPHSGRNISVTWRQRGGALASKQDDQIDLVE